MKKINRKGFTLIELLATIAIIGLVIGLSTFGIIKIVENSKNKAKDISMDSIKSSARIYSEEASSSDWKNITNEDYKYFCVTIQELINKGLLKEKEIKNYIENDNDKFNYVVVTKNKLTETVEKEEIISSDINNNLFKICTGSIVNETVNALPELKENTNYTDEIDISFVPAKFSDESIDENGNKVTPETNENECYYGATSSNLTTEGQIKDNSNICKIDSENGGLKNNNTYYVKVCTITKKGSRICSNAKSYTSANFKKPTITINNNVTITYYDDNIKSGAGHYFKSTLDGTSTSEVQKCDNSFNCEESSTTSITKDTWYKTNDSSVTLTYQNSGDGRVTARITDRSNNSSESSKDISVYKVTFNKGTADKIDGQATNISKTCTAEKDNPCKITSPSITKANYTVVGWNTNSSATTSSWNVGVEKNISNNSTYYPIVRINKVYIRFNTNGGTVTGETTTASGNIYKWKTDSNGLISRTNANGSTYSSDFFSIDYGSETASDALPDYNNSKYLKITKTGYSAVSESEWICQSGCTTSGKTYNQDTVYSASDFCDASTKDCTVVLGVNWQEDKEEINDYRCLGTDEYYITTCNSSDICNYTKKNGVSAKGTVNRNNLNKNSCYKDTINNYRCSGSDKYYITTCSSSQCNYTKKNNISTSGIILRNNLSICSFEKAYDLTKVTLKTYNTHAWSASSNCVSASTCTINTCNTIGIIPAGSTIYFNKCDTENSVSSAKFAYAYVPSSALLTEGATKGAGYNYLINGQNNGCGSYIDSKIVTKYNNTTYLYVRIPVYCNNSSCGYSYVTEPNVCE